MDFRLERKEHLKVLGGRSEAQADDRFPEEDVAVAENCFHPMDWINDLAKYDFDYRLRAMIANTFITSSSVARLMT